MGAVATERKKAQRWAKKGRIHKDFCRECGSKENLTIDHIIPLAKGGKTTEDNLEVLCEECHQYKDGNIQRYRSIPRFIVKEEELWELA